MKTSKFIEAQKAFNLKQGEQGTPNTEIGRKAGIGQATYFNWKKKYGGLLPDEMRRLSYSSVQSILKNGINRKPSPKMLTKTPKPDTRNPLPRGIASLVAEYIGPGGRPDASECAGVASLSSYTSSKAVRQRDPSRYVLVPPGARVCQIWQLIPLIRHLWQIKAVAP